MTNTTTQEPLAFDYTIQVEVPFPCNLRFTEEDGLNREMTMEELKKFIQENPDLVKFDLDIETGAGFKDWLIDWTSSKQDDDLFVECDGGY